VLFFGPSGTGKTHLAAGLVSAYRARFRRRPAVYIPAVDFSRELADAIETQATDDFRQRYRQAWLLAIDDVERLAGKEAAQRELASTLDAVAEAGRQVVLTSSLAPAQLAGFLPQLQTRLIEGLTVPLALPGPETRLAIVKCLAERRGSRLGECEARAFAMGLKASVRRLAGALAALEAACPGNGEVTLEAVEEYLARERHAAQPSLRQIAASVARHFSVRLTDLRSPSRRQAVVAARDVAMYLARTLTGNSLKQIGSYFSGRDHTTVSHGCSKAERLLRTDGTIRQAVERLREQLEPVWT
jgi:chromosomal replication initiator protein